MGNQLTGRGQPFLTVLVLLLVFVGALASPASGHPACPATTTLQGEIAAGDLTVTSITCNANGTGSATFTSEGAAGFLILGDFFESGTVGRKSTGQFFFYSTFEITDVMSGATLARGSKRFDGVGLFAPQFFCDAGAVTGEQILSFASEVQYTATIFPPMGQPSCDEQGRAFPGGSAFVGAPAEGGFVEDWAIDTPDVPPPPGLSKPGKATGGGRLLSGVTFGFNARDTDHGAHGHCNVVDHAAGKHIKCSDVTSFDRVGKHATFLGNATVNGMPTTYQIDVDDVAEPGRNGDMFSITVFMVPGYTGASGPLTQGNIQVH